MVVADGVGPVSSMGPGLKERSSRVTLQEVPRFGSYWRLGAVARITPWLNERGFGNKCSWVEWAVLALGRQDDSRRDGVKRRSGSIEVEEWPCTRVQRMVLMRQVDKFVGCDCWKVMGGLGEWKKRSTSPRRW